MMWPVAEAFNNAMAIVSVCLSVCLSFTPLYNCCTVYSFRYFLLLSEHDEPTTTNQATYTKQQLILCLFFISIFASFSVMTCLGPAGRSKLNLTA